MKFRCRKTYFATFSFKSSSFSFFFFFFFSTSTFSKSTQSPKLWSLSVHQSTHSYRSEDSILSFFSLYHLSCMRLGNIGKAIQIIGYRKIAYSSFRFSDYYNNQMQTDHFFFFFFFFFFFSSLLGFKKMISRVCLIICQQWYQVFFLNYGFYHTGMIYRELFSILSLQLRNSQLYFFFIKKKIELLRIWFWRGGNFNFNCYRMFLKTIWFFSSMVHT